MEKSRFSLQQVLDLKAHQKMKAMQEVRRVEKKKTALELRIKVIANELTNEERALQKEINQLVPGEIRIRLAYLDYMNQEMAKEIITLRRLCEKMATVRQRLLQYLQEEQTLRLFQGKPRLQKKGEMCGHANPLREKKTVRKTLHDTFESTFYKKYVS